MASSQAYLGLFCFFLAVRASFVIFVSFANVMFEPGRSFLIKYSISDGPLALTSHYLEMNPVGAKMTPGGPKKTPDDPAHHPSMILQ